MKIYTTQLSAMQTSKSIRIHSGQETCPEFTRKFLATSFLTATTLIYAIRAGITAAAGTSLAL